MAGKNNFASLRRFATKVYKFHQIDSINALNPKAARQQVHGGSINAVQLSEDEFNDISSGICATLAADWLREKLTSPDDKQFSGNSSGAGVHTGRNLATVRANVPKFLAYRKSPSVTEALAQHGLTASDSALMLNPVVSDKVMRQERSTNRHGVQQVQNLPFNVARFADSLTNACQVSHLIQGRGVYITFSVNATHPGKRSGNHAVAAYRSRDNSLYFFDPNCGVYKVQDVVPFFDAYELCYFGLGFELAIAANGGAFTYIDR